MAVKRMISLQFPAFLTRPRGDAHAPVPSHPATWPSSNRSRSSSTRALNVLTGETGAGKSILVEAVGLLLGGRASPDLVRTGEDMATVQAIFDDRDGGRAGRPAGGHRPGAEPRVRQRRARDGRRPPRSRRPAGRPARPARAPGAARSRHAPRSPRPVRRPRQRARAGRSARSRSTRRRSPHSTRFAPSRRSGPRAWRLRGVPARRDRPRETAAWRRRGTRGAAHAARERRAGPPAGRGELRHPLRPRRGGPGAASARSGSGSGSWPSLDARFVPYLEARDAVKSQLEDLAAFLRGYAASIDASPERLQEVEDRLALLERLKKKHGPTLADVAGQAGRARTGGRRTRLARGSNRGGRGRRRQAVGRLPGDCPGAVPAAPVGRRRGSRGA